MLQYNAMQVGIYQLLTTRRSQTAAFREYIETVRDYWVARSDLERAIGGPIQEQAALPMPH
jgi:cobalt-zinc-cadmium efflux system outer membrane protein